MRRLILAAMLAAGAAAMFAGCAEDTPEIFIVANQPFTEDCEVPTASTTVNQVFRSRGTLDLFITKSYVMAPRVESTLVGSGDVEFRGPGGGQGLTGNEWEANNILLRRALVQFDAPEALGVPLPRELEVELSGTITPGGAASIALQTITPSLGTTLANSRLLREGTNLTILLRVKLYGETMTGRSVDSNEFVYPVELCYGCLLNIPPTAIDPDYLIQPNCRNTETFSDEVDLATLCLTGQDEYVDCRLVCPLVTASPSGDPEGICEPNF